MNQKITTLDMVAVPVVEAEEEEGVGVIEEVEVVGVAEAAAIEVAEEVEAGEEAGVVEAGEEILKEETLSSQVIPSEIRIDGEKTNGQVTVF